MESRKRGRREKRRKRERINCLIWTGHSLWRTRFLIKKVLKSSRSSRKDGEKNLQIRKILKRMKVA